jgi:hypothetical protein
MAGVASKNWISGLIFYNINNEFPFLIFRSIIVNRIVNYSLNTGIDESEAAMLLSSSKLSSLCTIAIVVGYSIPETIQRRKFYLRGILSTVKVTVSSMLKISSSIEFVTTCAPIIFFWWFSRYETHVIICIMMLIQWRKRILKIVKIVIGIWRQR